MSLLTTAEVLKVLRVTRTTLYRRVRQKIFPAGMSQTGVAKSPLYWHDHELAALVAAYGRGAQKDELELLSRSLMAKRQKQGKT